MPRGIKVMAKFNQVLPDDVIGQALVYRTYDNVALAIIMNSSDPVFKGYKLVKPE